jgi:Meckel syndrome type 1 protein
VANDPQLAARISELAERARAGGRAFAALLPDAQGSVARAGAAGSEPWVQAQQLVSRLEGARSPTADALAELEALAIARSEDAGTSQEDRERVLAAVQEIRALAQAQRAELERLSGQLSSL